MREIILRVGETVERLDRYIVGQCSDLSRSLVQRLIRNGDVLLNGVPTQASYIPHSGDVVLVRVPTEPSPTPQPQSLPLEILYEDEALLVINKPAGMVVHPGAGHPTGTLVNALLAHRPELLHAGLDPNRPGIVHRLDRDTSGLIMVATTPEALGQLQRQFQTRRVDRTYLALAYGSLDPPEGAIEAPIGRDPRRRDRMTVLEGGRYARSEYRVREYLRGSSYLEVRLLTGRTHQIRVHLASIGHPVVGDSVYGPKRQAIEAPRQMLHAWRLTFEHPTRSGSVSLAAEPPDDLRTLLDRLQRST